MKSNKYILIACLGMGALLSSCDDFLETSPKDSLTEKIYFKNKEQFEAAANNLHTNVYAWNQGNTSFNILFDYGSDIMAAGGNEGNGTNVAGTTDTYWEQPYKWLRTVNQLIEKGEEYSNPTEIAASVGQAHFFRAWHHFFLLKRFGGVPIVTKVADVSDDVVWGERNSRYEVVGQILQDLDTAIEKLTASGTTAKSTNNDGHITLEAAQALKARVCLYEATWEKYVGAKTDGDGESEGAGSAKPENYPSIESMLTMAKTMAKAIIDSQSFKLWKGVESVPATLPNAEMYNNTSYFYLFNLEGAESNPNGLTKESNNEAIFRSVFDYTNRQGGMNISHTKPAGPTRKLMDMFLCEDGLPVQFSQYKPDYTTMNGEFEHRDYRLTSCTKKPFNYYWGFGKTSNGADYDTDITLNPTSSSYFYIPALRGNGNGYQGRKFTTEQQGRSSDKDESQDYMHIRLAEVYLIYAEATCELGDGEISDTDLDYSINEVRKRAGVAPLSHALIQPYPELTLLGEIRRERALELYGEGHRISDLCRWGIAEQDMASYPKCGVYVSYDGVDTEYTAAVSPADNKPIYDPAGYTNLITTQEYTVSAYAGIPKMKAGAVISENASDRQFSLKNYLQPIPTDQIKLNPKLKQNPDW